MKSDYYILQRDASTIMQLQPKVDLCYIDPPFGLGKDFSMTESDGEVKEFSDQWNSYDDFIIWYADIIEKCYFALNKNGWLYCHNNHLSNALVLSKVSMLNKYYTNISWRRSHPHNNIKNGWGNITDSILVFRKGNPYFEVEYIPLDEKYAANSFKNKDDIGYFALGPITGEKSRPGHMFEFKGYNPTYGWRKKREDIETMHMKELIYYGENKPYKKIYQSESKGAPVQNFWNDIHPVTRREGRVYPTQKPINLLKRIIESSCPHGGIVLDPFCGSGTTLFAALQLGRKCITSDISEQAISMTWHKFDNMLDIANTTGEDIWQ